MPIVRNIVRRSRRLSNQSPIAAEDYTYEDSFVKPKDHGVGTIDLSSGHASLSSRGTKAVVADESTSVSPVLSHLLSLHNRSSHSRKKEEGHIPRPPNAFIVFRSCLWSNKNFRSLESDHRNVSRIAGERWRNLSDEEKEPFVQMAKEAKALHAKMYPNYKYSPSHRSAAGSKRKPRRLSEEKTKCDLIASFLQKGVEGSALAHAMSNIKSENEHEIASTPILLPSASIAIPSALPLFKSPERRRRKTSVIRPRGIRSTTTQHRIAGPNLTTMNDRPLPVASDFWSVEADAAPSLEQPSGTPELMYPIDTINEFVPTHDIPSLHLDDICDSKIAELDPLSIFPPGVKPAGGLAYFGSGSDVMPFFSGANIQSPPTPSLIPTGIHGSPRSSDHALTPPLSPVVFTNPWSTFLVPCSPENELDEFFVQPISDVPPLSLYDSIKDHLTTKYTFPEFDLIGKDGQQLDVNLDDWIHFNRS